MTRKLESFGVKVKEVIFDRTFVKKLANILVVVAYIMFVVALASEVVFADSILDDVSGLLNDMQAAIIRWASYGLIIGVGLGTLMKKFSMGKQEKIEMGGKLMKNSIIAFLVLHATPKIVNFITDRIGKGTDSINM